MVTAIILLCVQAILLCVFCFFAFFKYLYTFASLQAVRFRRSPLSGQTCAVVIVAYNEEHVVEETIQACDNLTYEPKLIVLADDSSDPHIVEQRREFARTRGCVRVANHGFLERIETAPGVWTVEPIEIWESPEFVLFQRPVNTGFKAGSLRQVHAYLDSRGISVMYLLDADWHPQIDVLERAFEVLEADEQTAFVQTKRIARRKGMNLFQRMVSIMEETCYFVDFQGRQALRHPILFSGCCALMRLGIIRSVGGFQAGHLTEDLDLSNRLWLSGWRGMYAGNLVNFGEVPFAYDHFRRQQERWAAGTTACLRRYFRSVLRCRTLSTIEKASIIRQNAYFFGNVFSILAFATAFVTVAWILFKWDSYAVEFYLYVMQQFQITLVALMLWCIFSVFVGPIVMIFIHTRRFSQIVYLPMAVWYAWSIPFSYLSGNIKGILGFRLAWFRTPKFSRTPALKLNRSPAHIRAVYLGTLAMFLCFYGVEGWAFGWIDMFALIWIPSMILASIE